jgi:hypothetical protein
MTDLHSQWLRELVQLYGAAEVRNAIERIIINREVDDPEAPRHSSAAWRPSRKAKR